MQTIEKIKVLILEDNTSLAEAMQMYLNLEGFDVSRAENLNDAEAWLKDNDYDVLLLDLGLGADDGFEWFQQHKHRICQRGVLVVSARTEAQTKMACLTLGADAYMMKPVIMQELSVTIRNLAGRVRANQPKELEVKPTAKWLLDPIEWLLISPDNKQINLSATEFDFLCEMAKVPGKPVSREQLIKAIGQNPEVYDPRRLEILVRRIRAKLEEALLSNPIQTVRNKGYAFASSVSILN